MNYILNHITKSIESSTLIKDPFKHKFVNNVFPKEYYLQLLNNLPLKSNYIALTKTGLVSKNYNSERFVFDPHNKEILE